jgi:DNA mismatch endonuclease Vsr
MTVSRFISWNMIDRHEFYAAMWLWLILRNLNALSGVLIRALIQRVTLGASRWGFRYRKNVPGMPGRPDIVLSKYKTAVFVHGCFWHNHRGCKIANFPKTNSEFWKAKFDTNIKRDRRNARALHAAGWRVLVVWECELTPIGRAVRTAKKIGIQIRGPLGSR